MRIVGAEALASAVAPDESTDRAIERAVGALDRLMREKFDHLSTQIRGVHRRLDEMARRDEMRGEDIEDMRTRVIGLEAVQSDHRRQLAEIADREQERTREERERQEEHEREERAFARIHGPALVVSIIALLCAIAGVVVAAT